MNQTFDFNRFLNVCHQQWHTSRKKYFTTLGMVLGIVLVVVLWILVFRFGLNGTYIAYNDSDPLSNSLGIMFWVGLAIYWCLAGSQIFKPLSNKLTAISSLMLPASQFEKYLVRWLMMVPVAFILYCIGFEIINMFHCIWMSITVTGFSVWHMFDFWSALSQQSVWGALASFAAIQSLFVLGGILWPKRPVVTTFGVLFLLQWIYGLIATGILCLRISDGSWCLFYDDEPNETSYFVLLVVISGVICLVNYTLTYFRYREAEIINRW